MAFKPEDRERAYRVWLECRNISQTARTCGVPQQTVQVWSQRYQWEDRRAKALSTIPYSAREMLESETDEAKAIGIRKIDLSTMENIKIVENISMAAITGNAGMFIADTEVAALPKDFKEAIDALSKCWAARERIIARSTPKSAAGPAATNATPTININLVDLVRQSELMKSANPVKALKE